MAHHLCCRHLRQTLDRSRSDFLSSMPSSLKNYRQWTQPHNLPGTVDELLDRAHILWIGPKHVNPVILYCHGDTCMTTCTGNVMTFYRYFQLELEQCNIHVGIAIPAYI
ncbi:hypothetical protein EDD18DRAFT_664712 [Armillaria luteobubalina]|uniref:Uncharacterized protein n=1 Tax=Armillaria luteobubalina TaxID=153913 RepID=A0AA39PLY1_9AGAR|nr:hypothetical protein EDD18DRAFT_664712 [Armillaria luteobubalina]